jgi:hypothetical protein
MEKDIPKVGDLAFGQVWRDSTCQALLVEVDDVESYAQVTISQNGSVLWSSPKVEFHDHDFAFGTWYDGNGLPFLFDDIDGDGQPELLATVPKGDLTPTVFRVFRWDGQTLSLLRKSSLLRDHNGDFVWTEVDPQDESQLIWIDYFEDGLAQVVHRRRATISRSTVMVKAVPRGFVETT